jgi:hypothetical protein
MGKWGTVDTAVDELSVLLKAALSKLLGWYPVLKKVGEGNDDNPSVPYLMGLEAELALQLMKKMGLVIHKQPHGWQIIQRAWNTQKMSRMELNKRKVGKKHHYFLKVGGDLIHAQPFKQYLEEAFFAKPKHCVRGASCDFLMDVAE